MIVQLRWGAATDTGRVRVENEDNFLADGRAYVVADGMGGHAAGDVASKVVITALEHLDDDAPSGDMLQALRAAVFDGSEHLREVIRESPQLEGMGTTLTAVLFAGAGLAAVRPAPYLAATALGLLPSTVLQVGAGASVEHLDRWADALTGGPAAVAAGAVLAAAGLALWWRRR